RGRAAAVGRGLLRRLAVCSAVRPARERPGDVPLVHARGGGLHVEPGALEHREDLLAGDPPLLGYLVDALLRHQRTDSKRSSTARIEPLSEPGGGWPLGRPRYVCSSAAGLSGATVAAAE